MADVKANVVPRRNARGGRGAAENLIAALRCLYRHAEDDGLITGKDNPARKVEKPSRPLAWSSWRAIMSLTSSASGVSVRRTGTSGWYFAGRRGRLSGQNEPEAPS